MAGTGTSKHAASHPRVDPKRPAVFYGVYTLVFAVVALCVYSQFIVNGKSFVFCDVDGGGDGLVQHFNAFCYYGQYLRTVLGTIFIDHSLNIPLWDMSIGYGQDIIGTLSYYVIGDPFSFLSVFVPRKFAEFGYCALIIMRLWCAGLAFSAYCRYRGHRGWPVLVGAVLYVFCFYALASGVLHPYFLLPMVFLPLILLGVERLFEGKGPVVYIISMAIAALSNFYFFYMLCLILVVYCVIRYVELFASKRSIGHFLKTVWAVVWPTLLALGIAAVLLVPSIIGVLGNSRVSADNAVPLTYAAIDYLRFLPSFVDSGYGSYSYLGYTALGLLSVPVLAMKARGSRESRFLLLGLVILLGFFLIPFFGHLFNGMGYVTNRWSWALAMLVAYIVVTVIPEFKSLSLVEWVILGCCAVAFAAYVMCVDAVSTPKHMVAMVQVLVLFALLAILVRVNAMKWLEPLVCCAVCVGVALNAFFLYAPGQENYLKNFTSAGEACSMLVKQSPAYALIEVDDGSVVRFDTAALSTGAVKRNSQMLLDLNGISYYFSSTNPRVGEFARELQLNYSMDQTYNSLDRRAVLQNLAGVKYLVIPKGSEQYLPKGYEDLLFDKGRYSVYTSSDALPLGFTSGAVMPVETFKGLNVAEKELALMQGVVADVPELGMEALAPSAVAPLDTTINDGDNVEVDGLTLAAKKDDASIQLSFEEVVDGEIYVVFEGVSFEKGKTTDTSFNIIVSDNAGMSTTVVYRTPRNNYYCGRDSFVANLGYSQAGRSAVTITFSKEGVYSFDAISVIVPDRASVGRDADALREDVLENVEVGTNEISGTIKVDKPKMLCVQVPFSDGWTATVDGQRAETYQADVMFTGLLVQPGEHQIQLHYETPYLRASALISLVSVVALIMLVLLRLRNRET